MLGIVIANWNGEKLIDECLRSLENQSFKAFKLYIIDNNSKDKSKEVIKRYNEKLNIDLTEMNYNSGFAQANNIGIKKAINDGLDAVMDDAIVIEEKLFGSCFETEDQKAGMGNFLEKDKEKKLKVVPFKNC